MFLIWYHNRLNKINAANKKTLIEMINYININENSCEFKYPVDWKGLELDSYPVIIKKPMDLSQIEKNIK